MKKLILPLFLFTSIAVFGQAEGSDSLAVLPNNEPQIAVFDVNAYPNPVNELLEITSNLTQSTDLWVSVTNSNGQIIRRELWKNNGSSFNGRINTSGIPGGLYTIHLSNGSNSVFKKIIISH